MTAQRRRTRAESADGAPAADRTSSGAAGGAQATGRSPEEAASRTASTNRYRVEALGKGLRLLSLFTPQRPLLRVKELADLSGIPMPSVFRLVSTLEEEGYLERSPDGRVRPGTGVLALGFASLQGLDLVETSARTLHELAEVTGATVNLGVLHHDAVLFVARLQSSSSMLAANLRVGSTVPAVYSSIGKVLLAHLGREEFARRISESSFIGDWGPRAVRNVRALNRQLDRVRSDGYLVQEEEAIAGLSSVAAPISQAGAGVVAGVNVAVASSNYTHARMVDELCGPLLATAETITQRLGGNLT